jgi:hypothetical protein
MQNTEKNKPDNRRLEEVLPDGLVVNRKWLQVKGYERSNISSFSYHFDLLTLKSCSYLKRL